jgi:hypothetical protein
VQLAAAPLAPTLHGSNSESLPLFNLASFELRIREPVFRFSYPLPSLLLPHDFSVQ